MKPSWLKIKLPRNDDYENVKILLERSGVNTVCTEAKCPNRIDCWGRKAMTFMILGSVCTRNCRFCAVLTGDPEGKIDINESAKIGQIVNKLGLHQVIITSVTRDDLIDGGASVYAQTIRIIRNINPDIKIEVLVPDFAGAESSIKTIIDAGCDIFSHNVETVKRLTSLVRDPRADYTTSLQVLNSARKYHSDLLLKSGFMVGLGETECEVKKTITDLFNAGANILTIGQYLQPTKELLPVTEYITPAVFQKYRQYALATGFTNVFSGPLIRSSYSRIF